MIYGLWLRKLALEIRLDECEAAVWEMEKAAGICIGAITPIFRFCFIFLLLLLPFS